MSFSVHDVARLHTGSLHSCYQMPLPYNCGLTVQTVEDERLVESGWHVLSSARSRGYATEAAEAVREFARELGVDHLIAIIRPNNVASQRVATKIGLTLEREVHKNGGPALIFGADLSQ
ncbi:GNAT family N-acetyltransferase [Brevibacterium aurantiacum]|uniref:GNAT family N-acetyltransferase n=1 Tax=Brevibacterium aurantiacum TaxID=273384 RepID=UPI001D057D33|nr:GNAT family N-acetyltransferase [Brevibacterium aurantiacum]